MSLFNKKRKEIITKASCCNGNLKDETTKSYYPSPKDLEIKILGGGCAKCKQLENATKTALEQLGMDTAIEHVTDFVQIASHGVMTTPALVVNDKVVSYGKVLKVNEVKKIIKQIREIP